MSIQLTQQAHKKAIHELGFLKNVLLISSSTGISRVLGLVRDMVIAYLFGASRAYDAYLIAFMIPHMLRRLLAEGALSSAFIPVFTEHLKRDGPNRAARFANTVVTTALLFFPGLVALGVLAAPVYVPFFADGFSADQLKLTIQLTQITFPFIALVGIAAIFMGVLNSYERFFAPAFAPVLFNVGVIVSAFSLMSFFTEPIYALAVGVLLGGLGQLLFQMPYLRDHWQYRPMLNLHDESLHKLLRLMLPSVVGLTIFQINTVVDNKLASHLAEGSVSVMQYAIRLFQLPLGIFAVSVGSVILPRLSAHAATRDVSALAQTLREGMKFSLFILLPATAGLYALAEPIIQLLFEHGNFTPDDTRLTVYALLHYLPGLIGYALAYVLTRAFYALQDTRTPLFVGAVTVALNVVLDYALVGPMGVGGLALATSLAGIANALVLLLILRRTLPHIEFLDRDAAKMLGTAVGMGIATYLCAQWLSPLGEFLSVGLSIALGAGLYFSLAWLGGFFTVPKR
jgi:putative peptidoglycan lipid II flippase